MIVVEIIGVLALILGVWKIDELNRTVGGAIVKVDLCTQSIDKIDSKLDSLQKEVMEHGAELKVLRTS